MNPRWLDLPFLEAVAHLLSLKPTPRSVFNEMTREERARAFTVAHVSKLSVVQEMLDSLREASVKGQTLQEFVAEFEKTGLTQTHLETVYRTNTQSAFGAGRWTQGKNDIFWGWRYKTVGDERVREAHAELDGLVFEKDARPEIFPPWDFNCRCASEWITRLEARRNGYVSDEIPEGARAALQATEFASPALGRLWRPDMSSFDLALVSRFVQDQEEAGSE